MKIQVETDEQSIKPDSLFLKLENESRFVVKSNVIIIHSYFIPKKGSVACLGKDDYFANKKVGNETLRASKKFYYWGTVTNGKDVSEGIVEVPGGVFFDMNNNERLLEEDKRHFEWIISKEGTGKQTKYAAVRGKNVEITEEEAMANNEKLQEKMQKYWDTLVTKHESVKADFIMEE